ncbi:MAG TPA: VacB/RNase II family 3'-5' exoribonuclease, partial [Burkholderiales bacterium]|nr:VacB/RNase II family 3'-5' exoribonuclease [Burkholderiales bacterium]
MNQRKTRRSLRARGRRERAPRHAYEVPGRESILATLTELGVPVEEAQLEQLLKIGRHEREGFLRRIAAMEREGEIMRNRRGAICVVAKLDLVRGRVQGHADGFGFLVRDDGGPDLFLGPKEMHQVLHGDRVVCRIAGIDRRGRPEGKIVEVLERSQQRVVGRLHREHGILFVSPEDKRIAHEFLIAPNEAHGAKAGQIVTAEILAQPSKHAQPVAKIVEVLGDYEDPGMEIEVALRKHALPYLFPRQAERLCAALPNAVTDEDCKGRDDLTHLALVTIDGESAKDFDDAVYCEPSGTGDDSGFRLVVAIADVSHYVKHADALDEEARLRGNSVYFPRRVIPMLPEKLSNGLCSLNPDVPRLAMACDMQIDGSGEIESYRFFPAVIRSHARLTYTEVAAMLENERGEAARNHAALLPHLRALYRLYRQLARARARRGAIDFETIETEMIFDERGKIARIVPVVRNDAHRLIEECMLAANVCTSGFLRQHRQSMLYR